VSHLPKIPNNEVETMRFPANDVISLVGEAPRYDLGDLVGAKPTPTKSAAARSKARPGFDAAQPQAPVCGGFSGLTQLVNANPSSAQPVMPPIMTFTRFPSFASLSAALSAPLQCDPAQ